MSLVVLQICTTPYVQGGFRVFQSGPEGVAPIQDAQMFSSSLSEFFFGPVPRGGSFFFLSYPPSALLLCYLCTLTQHVRRAPNAATGKKGVLFCPRPFEREVYHMLSKNDD